MLLSEVQAWRAKRRLQAGCFARQRKATRAVWDYVSMWGPEIDASGRMWGFLDDLAKRSTFRERVVSSLSTCDFGPCWPTRASCSYARVCTSATRMHTR